jgi:hypothetical protein
VLGGPLPGEHALARAAHGVEQKNGMGVGSPGPVSEDVELGLGPTNWWEPMEGGSA